MYQIAIRRYARRATPSPTMLLVVSLSAWSTAALAQPPEPNRFEKDIQAFEQQDRESPPPEGAVLFVGSSTIRRWNLAASFPDLTFIGRGFGGSQTSDALEFADRIILPYKPKVVVLYEGDNDIGAGKTPDQVVADYQALARKIHEALPETQLVFLGIKPSLKRWNLVETMRATNARIREIAEHASWQTYVDTDAIMLGADGKPRPELFVEDGLHMSEAGYAIWAGLVREHLPK